MAQAVPCVESRNKAESETAKPYPLVRKEDQSKNLGAVTGVISKFVVCHLIFVFVFIVARDHEVSIGGGCLGWGKPPGQMVRVQL